MKKIVNTKELTHEQWLEYRRKGIGGSDVSAILGLNPWQSAYHVWQEKTSEEPPKNMDSERMRVGRDLEDYVAKRFEEATGKKVRRNNYLLQHDEHDFMLANIDREIIGENAILECKTTNSYSIKDWQDGPPAHYELQCHHYMAVTGAETCYIAVLIGNEAFKYYEVKQDSDIENMLIKAETAFWELVQTKQPPAPDGSSEYSKMLDQKFMNTIENAIDITNEENIHLIERLDEINELSKQLDTEKEEIQQQFKVQMKNNEVATISDRKITWKAYVRTSLDSKTLKKDHPSVYEQYQKISEYKRFSIK